MQSWPAPDVPDLPGSGRVLRLRDRAGGDLQEVGGATGPGTAGLYVCGITPYDATHLGHAATYLAFDLVVRAWRDQGVAVTYVQNVTDIDEPLLERAERDGVDWRALAARETDLFRADMQALRIVPPTHFVGAVEAMDTISDAVLALRERGVTYEVSDPDAGPDVYLEVARLAGFGRLAGLDRARMIALFGENGGDPERRGKRDALDSLLWRAERPDEPAWDSALGRGRPGWHVECAAIAVRHMGPRIDVQGGGSDLAFPHHEHSTACAEAMTGETPFATATVHSGMIGLEGEKMSKSRGNLVLVSGLRAQGRSMAAVRLALLAGHYRRDREWSQTLLSQAEQRLERWRIGVSRAGAPDAAGVREQVRTALAQDLDTPAALTAIDAWCEAEGSQPGAGAQVSALVDALLGVSLRVEAGQLA